MVFHRSSGFSRLIPKLLNFLDTQARDIADSSIGHAIGDHFQGIFDFTLFDSFSTPSITPSWYNFSAIVGKK
jgi:hypothetical protein